MNYQYACDNCKTISKKKHSMKEHPKFFCDDCGAELRQLITGGCGFILKGNGWYCKDYPKDKK